jgi:hypothetical protein
MFIIRSEPVDRDIHTISLNPILASQAPSVNIIIDRCGVKILFMHVNTVINIIDDNIIASRQNSDIKKCFN